MKIGSIFVLFCVLMAFSAFAVLAMNETAKQNATKTVNTSMKNVTLPMNQTMNKTGNMTALTNMTKSSNKVKVAATSTSGASNPKPAVKSIVVVKAKNTTNNK